MKEKSIMLIAIISLFCSTWFVMGFCYESGKRYADSRDNFIYKDLAKKDNEIIISTSLSKSTLEKYKELEDRVDELEKK